MVVNVLAKQCFLVTMNIIPALINKETPGLVENIFLCKSSYRNTSGCSGKGEVLWAAEP